MILEIVGGLLLFAFGSIAIAEWFALQKLNAEYDRLQAHLEEAREDLDW